MEHHPLTELQKQLLDVVLAHGYLKLDEPVRLRSGELSAHFIDGKKALADGEDLELACRALLELVAEAELEFDVVGGLTLGADQFAHGVAIVGRKKWFVVRKQRKGRGTNKLIEGAELGTGVRVLLVDDVVSTGGSIKQAYDGIIENGADVVAAVTLVDRGNVARRFFKELGVPYLPLLTYEDLDIPPVGEDQADPVAVGR
jgi:orotate phosphoribosyltransferase